MDKRDDMMLPALAPAIRSLGDNEIGAYVHTIQNVPILTEERELQLAHDYHDNGNVESARALVLSHLRLVVAVSRDYAGYGLNQSDLIQEGNIGLMKAVKRFNPTLGVRLATFALYWIKSEMHEFILRNWRIVKIATTKSQRKLFFNLRKRLAALGENIAEKTPAALSRYFDVSEKDVVEMTGRMRGYDVPLGDIARSASADTVAPIDHLVSDDGMHAEDYLVEKKSGDHLQGLLFDALAQLDERSLDIVKSRRMSEATVTLEALSHKYGISIERVRQIENQAIGKIRRYIESIEPNAAQMVA